MNASALPVLSWLPSSTYTISAGRPSSNNTSFRRRCSSSSVAASLNSGTTTDRYGVAAVLRNMTEAPSNNRHEVVTNEIDSFGGHERADVESTQKVQLARARFDETRVHPRQSGVDVTGMHHQICHSRFVCAHE